MCTYLHDIDTIPPWAALSVAEVPIPAMFSTRENFWENRRKTYEFTWLFADILNNDLLKQ